MHNFHIIILPIEIAVRSTRTRIRRLAGPLMIDASKCLNFHTIHSNVHPTSTTQKYVLGNAKRSVASRPYAPRIEARLPVDRGDLLKSKKIRRPV